MADSKKYDVSKNLFNKNAGETRHNLGLVLDSGTSAGWYYTSNYVVQTTRIPVEANTTYTLSIGSSVNNTVFRLIAIQSDTIPDSETTVNGRSILYVSDGTKTVTFTTLDEDKYVVFQTNGDNNITELAINSLMLNAGSTALPYEPYGSQWQHSLRKLATATEAVENPLYSDGTAITAYTLKGNTVQNGTPTPSNPVEVNGVGVRTENLLDMSTVYVGYHLDITTGLPIGYGNSRMATLTPVDVSQFSAVTIAYTSVGDTIQFMYSIFDSADALIERVAGKVSGDSINVSSAAKLYIAFYRDTALTINSVEDVILNEGTTPRSYEPYGYKIPISSGGVTTNIYLGSTQTVRQVKKLVFDGREIWSMGSGATPYPYIARANMPYPHESDSPLICSHFPNTDLGMVNGTSYAFLTGGYAQTGATDLASWKQYLADQYSNGTPVTVWYVLATAETGTVNEPLMKIGDYADTLSNAASIPTTEGANSITVDTTVQPSEFSATWTGWHDASVKEWDGSDWQ